MASAVQEAEDRAIGDENAQGGGVRPDHLAGVAPGGKADPKLGKQLPGRVDHVIGGRLSRFQRDMRKESRRRGTQRQTRPNPMRAGVLRRHIGGAVEVLGSFAGERLRAFTGKPSSFRPNRFPATGDRSSNSLRIVDSHGIVPPCGRPWMTTGKEGQIQTFGKYGFTVDTPARGTTGRRCKRIPSYRCAAGRLILGSAAFLL